MATVVLKNGTRREFSRVEIDTNGGTVKAIEDYQEVDSFPMFHIALVTFDDGLVYIEDKPPDDW